MTLVALMRHASTQWNEAGRIQGWLDSPLSVAGRAQAEEWGGMLAGRGFSRIVSSDLGRAMTTARIISDSVGLPIAADARFRERDYGTLAGAPAAAHAPLHRPEPLGGGEALADVRSRVMEGLGALGGVEGERVLVVTHAGVLWSVLSMLAGPAHQLRDGRLLKSRRLHWVGVSGVVGIVELNSRMKPREPSP